MKQKRAITVRDYFAAHALTHISAFNHPDLELPPPSLVAKYSFAVADAMLSLRHGATATTMGRKGGLARAAKLAPEIRREIARRAAAARWGRK
jgi:hypothetical protein